MGDQLDDAELCGEREDVVGDDGGVAKAVHPEGDGHGGVILPDVVVFDEDGDALSFALVDDVECDAYGA